MLPIVAPVEQMADGSYTASKRSYGDVIKVTWGLQAAKTAVMAELRSKRNSLVEHTLAFTDPTGTTHTKSVLWPGEPEFQLIPGYLYGAITVTFYQRG